MIKRTVVPAAKGKAIQARQRLLAIAARADFDELIRQGRDDVAQGRTRPAKKVFAELRRRHAIPR